MTDPALPATQGTISDVQVLTALARVTQFIEAGEYKAAEEYIDSKITPFELAEDVRPETIGLVACYQGVICENTDRQGEALEFFLDAMNADPSNSHLAIHFLGCFLGYFNAGSEETLHNCVDICNQHLKEWINDDLRGQFYLFKGISLFHLGNIDEAIVALKEAEFKNPFTHLMLGYAYLLDENYLEAERALQEVPETFEAYPEALAIRALCTNLDGDVEVARALYQMTHQQSHPYPEMTPIREDVFRVVLSNLCEGGFTDEVLEHVRFMQGVTNPKTDFYHNLQLFEAECLIELGVTEHAEDILGDLIPLASEDPKGYREVFFAAANLQLDQGNFANALPLYQLGMAGVIADQDKAYAIEALDDLKNAAQEGGYPVLEKICSKNIARLSRSYINDRKFPELIGLKLE